MIVPMQKVAVVAHRPLREQVLDALQDAGLLHVREATDAPQIDHSESDFRLAELQFAINTLKDVASKDALAKAQRPATDQEISAAYAQTNVREVVDALHALERSDTDAAGVIQESAARMALLSPWTRLPYRLDAPRSTAFTIVILGTMPPEAVDAFRRDLQERLPRTGVDALDAEGTAKLVAHVWKDDVAAFEEIATRHGWTTVDLPVVPGTTADIVSEAAKALSEAEKTRRKNAEQRIHWSRQLPALVRVATYMQWLDAKQSVREQLSETSSVMTLLGWMPKKKVHALERRLQRISPAIAVLPVKADEGEEPPVHLKNSKLITPFQSVTTLYGLPLSHEMDPTPLLAPFFIVYYALCLTDGGYGLALALIMGAALLKTKKTIEQAPLLWLLFFCGIVSILVGIPFGGWFGLTPEQVPSFLTYETADGGRLFLGQIWNLGEQSGISFLQNLALGLGITHLFFGMFLAGYHKWIHGDRAAAFWLDFTPHLTLAAGIAYFFAPPEWKQTALYALYGAAALLVWGKGHGSKWFIRPLMGLIGVANLGIALLSNGLSYLRILALGLVTGAIALAVNQVAIEMSKLFPWFLSIPVIVVIAVGGHAVSIALNALGSFIHSGRLQFIEFFGQFFEGGGNPFLPFSRKTAPSS